VLGGYRRFGQRVPEADALRADVEALEQAGVFAIVAEMVEVKLAGELSRMARTPVIGIGSGPDCDGQILVAHDILGLNERAPSFVKQYAKLQELTREAFAAYAADVRERRFPEAGHVPARPAASATRTQG
jgi:3-methyl-2-oxobutanoate hydroxymethyltransferase